MTRSAPAPHLTPSRPTGRRARIAIGTDGSTWGDTALDWALRHAAALNAELHIYAASTCDDQEIARRLHAYRWLPTSVTGTTGAPIDTLLAASADNDLLVIGYRGHRHGSLGLGHTVLPIVTDARCDTVIVRGETAAVHGEHGWITAAIGSHTNTTVVRRAAQIARRWRSKLRLLHASPIPAAHQVAAPNPAEPLERARQAATGLTPSLQITRGHPHDAVRTCARTDLLVIGPGSRPGRLSLITSTALHHAPCPVLVARPG